MVQKTLETNWSGTDMDQTTNPNIDIKEYTRTKIFRQVMSCIFNVDRQNFLL